MLFWKAFVIERACTLFWKVFVIEYIGLLKFPVTLHLSPSPTLPAPFAPLSSPLSLSYTTSSPHSPLLPSLPLLHYRLTTSHAKYTADETMYPAQTAKVSRFQRMVHMVTCHPFPMRISTRIRSQSANLLHTSPM